MRSVPSIKVCIALMFFAAGAQAAHMVADINAVAAARGAVLSGWVQQGSNALFLMDDRIHGKELWRTDGTRAGTALVKDIAPGPASSGITALTPLNGVLYFLANDGTNGQELWRSDGTTSGTHIVADINAGSGDGAAVGTDSGVPIPVLNGVLYFAGTDAAGTSALWRSDGTSGGTYRVSTGSPAGEGGAPFQIAATASRIFFDGFDAAAGEELWISDGTQAGTHRVVDIRPGNQSSFPDSLTATSAGLFFTADDGTHGRALWFADDTSAHVVTNLDAENPCLNFGKLTAFGADVIANAAVPIGPSCGSNVIRANSTGVQVLAPGVQSDGFVPYGGRLLFSADGTGPALQLWVTDGTPTGTKRLRAGDELVTATLIGAGSPKIGSLTGSDGVYFFGYTGAPGFGINLWRTDGTDAGTVQYALLPADLVSSDMAQFQGKIFFDAGTGGSSGEELWQSDGTPAGTVQFADLNPGASSSSPDTFAVIGGRLYFQAASPEGANPWVSDGTVDGTMALTALRGSVATGDGLRYTLTAIGNRVVFPADDGVHGNEPWVSDGTAEGTFLLRDINADPGATGPTSMFMLNSNALFLADDGVHGVELWITDGTGAGTRMVKDINPGAASSNAIDSMPSHAVLDGVAYFSADDGVHGKELWRSDGTDAGTFMVSDLIPGAEGAAPGDLHALLNHHLVFLSSGSEGPQWWATDGTAAGTNRLTSGIYVVSSSPAPMMNGAIYFGAQAGLPGNVTHVQLWRTDGTVAGTQLVADPASGDKSTLIGAMYEGGDHVLFQYCNDAGCSLFSSDGTAAGTSFVSPEYPNAPTALLGNRLFYTVISGKDFIFRVTDGTPAGTHDILKTPADLGGSVSSITIIQNQVLFTRYDPIAGFSIWKTDGTPSGTALVSSLVGYVNDGTGDHGGPNNVTEAGGNFFFIGYAPQTGSELYVMDGPSPNASADSAATAAATPVQLAVVANDGVLSGTLDSGSVTITSPPSHGTAIPDSETGVVTYTPASDFSGVDQFVYTVASMQGLTSDPATAYIIVGQAAGPSPGTAPVPPPPSDGGSDAPPSGGGGGGGGRVDAADLAALAALYLLASCRCRLSREKAVVRGRRPPT